MDEVRALVNLDESERRGERIAKFLARFSPKTSLDVGCSSGFLVRALRKSGIEAYGLDNDGSRFSAGIREYLFLVDAGAGAFPFAEGRIDLVTALTSLDYVRDFRHALDEIKRVIRNNGWLVMTFATDPRLRFPARPSVFPTKVWTEELTKRGFSCSRRLASELDWELGAKPEIEGTFAERLPRSAVMLWRRVRGRSYDCIVARLDVSAV